MSEHKNLFSNVVRLGWVSALNDISTEMLYAITPLFITRVLGASVGVVGIIEGIAEGTASILKGGGGWLSDRTRRRKPLVTIGYVFSAFSRPIIGMSSGWGMVLFARILDRFGKAVRTAPRDALIADSVDQKTFGKAFGLHRAMDTAGAFTGVLISLVLLMYLKSSEPETSAFRFLYMLSFVPSAIGVLLMITVREVRPEIIHEGIERPPLDLRFGKRYYGVLILFAFMSLGLSSDAFLLLRAGDVGWPAEAVIVAYLLFNASYGLLSYPIGKWADRVRMERLLALGMFVYAGVYFGFGVMPSPWLVFPLFAVYGLYSALTDGVSKALISSLVESSHRATAIGVFNTVSGVCVLIASLAAGWLWDHVSVSAPFYLGAVLALVAGVGFLFLNRPVELSE